MAGFPNPVMGNDTSQDRASIVNQGHDKTAPTLTVGAAVGTGGTATLKQGSTDLRGTIIVNTGTTPPAGGLVTVTFSKAFDVVPVILLTGSQSTNPTFVVNAPTATSFIIYTTSALSASINGYEINYVVVP